MSAGIAVVAGCGVVTAGREEPSTTTITAESINGPPCPDPTTDCTQSNGTGVFTEEGGYAGIGTSQFMITHFTNLETPHGAGVLFQGRYRSTPSGRWLFLAEPGIVGSASYGSRPNLRVVSVTESGTVPTWTLLEEGSTSPISVSDTELLDLRLELLFLGNPGMGSVGTGPEPRSLWLMFDDIATVQDKHTVHAYNLRWLDEGTAGNPAVQYCVDASQAADPVVFQQGIKVDPVTGAVTRDAGVVTMSCLRGAPATVYRWGYGYQSNPTFYFDAGIQLKRASYCANSQHYTIANTMLEIRDDRRVNDTTIRHLEAMWTPTGASCVNLQNLRHAEMGFTGWCANTQLPSCIGLAPRAGIPTLADGPVTPGP